MNYGAEPADQVVRYSLEGMEYSLKITGNVAKHVAIFIAAALKDQKKTRGKTRLTRMLKEQRPMKFFTVPGDRLKEFAKEAKVRHFGWIRNASKFRNPSNRQFPSSESGRMEFFNRERNSQKHIVLQISTIILRVRTIRQKCFWIILNS